MSTTVEVLLLRRRYWANNYRPMAVRSQGTRPLGDRWRDEALRDPPVWTDRIPEPEALNTGILTGNVVAVSVDVLVDDVATHIGFVIAELLGRTSTVRISHGPRRLFLFRAERPFPTQSTGTFVAPDGSEAQVEILGEGGYVIADGEDLETGCRFSWPDRSLATVALQDLPCVTEKQAQAFLGAVSDIFRQKSWRPKAEADHEPSRPNGLDNAASSESVAWTHKLHFACLTRGNAALGGLARRAAAGQD